LAKTFKTQTPGAEPASNELAADVETASAELDVLMADNARLNADVARLTAANVSLKDALDEALAIRTDAIDAGSGVAPIPKYVSKILTGTEDWSSMTSTEARAKGCDKTVMCADGIFVP